MKMNPEVRKLAEVFIEHMDTCSVCGDQYAGACEEGARLLSVVWDKISELAAPRSSSHRELVDAQPTGGRPTCTAPGRD